MSAPDDPFNFPPMPTPGRDRGEQLGSYWNSRPTVVEASTPLRAPRSQLKPLLPTAKDVAAINSSLLQTSMSSQAGHANKTLSHLNASYHEENIVPPLDDMVREYQAGLSILIGGNSADAYAQLAALFSGCKHRLNTLDKLISNYHTNHPGGSGMEDLLDDAEFVRLEGNTWLLLSTVFKDMQLSIEEEAVSEDLLGAYREEQFPSHQTLINSLMATAPDIRHRQLVIDWLERCASGASKEFVDDVYYEAEPVTWGYTLDKLKRGRVMGQLVNQKEVKLFDPDVPSRSGLSIDGRDEEEQNEFLKKLFSFLRAGNLDACVTECCKVGQEWRAASLFALSLWHDANTGGPGNEAIKPAVGNLNRHLAMEACLIMSRDERIPLYERALYSALCGYSDGMVQVCQTWEDHVWAHYKAALAYDVEQKISQLTGLSGVVTLPKPQLPLVDLVAKIPRSHVLHHIQRGVMCGDVDGVISLMASTLQQGSLSPSVTVHYARVAAHLLLFFKKVKGGEWWTEPVASNASVILHAYIDVLIKQKQHEVIPTYIRELNIEEQERAYIAYLRPITTTTIRHHTLINANHAGFDVCGLALSVANDSCGVIDAKTAGNASEMIGAIEWVLFNPSQLADALVLVNHIVRTFLVTNRIDEAFQALGKISHVKYEEEQKSWPSLSALDNGVYELQCYVQYHTAIDAYEKWHRFFLNKPAAAQPTSSTPARPNQSLQSGKSTLSDWSSRVAQMREKATKAILDIVTSPTGWLVDQKQGDESDDKRSRQLVQLRHSYLPQLCLTLHRVFFESEMYFECMQIANVIADEDYGLCDIFGQEKQSLRSLLMCMRSAALRNLELGKDPLGY